MKSFNNVKHINCVLVLNNISVGFLPYPGAKASASPSPW